MSRPRGFAAMDPARQREIASKGGKAVSSQPGYMARIGSLGGEAVSQDREHMAEIGRIGGIKSTGGSKVRRAAKDRQDAAEPET